MRGGWQQRPCDSSHGARGRAGCDGARHAKHRNRRRNRLQPRGLCQPAPTAVQADLHPGASQGSAWSAPPSTACQAGPLPNRSALQHTALVLMSLAAKAPVGRGPATDPAAPCLHLECGCWRPAHLVCDVQVLHDGSPLLLEPLQQLLDHLRGATASGHSGKACRAGKGGGAAREGGPEGMGALAKE